MDIFYQHMYVCVDLLRMNTLSIDELIGDSEITSILFLFDVTWMHMNGSFKRIITMIFKAKLTFFSFINNRSTH